MLAKDITSICKVRVLLVPISPIKKSTFDRHVELLQEQCQSVSLADITPNSKAKFSSQIFQEGQLHFQFQTEWTREEAHLQDFQPYRRLFGVIGIMDCQEWDNLSVGYHQFEKYLSKYPTAIATRCFAFDPIETQEDDTKGLIMIPNVGNISFYMTTMISDFASNILEQLENLAYRVENSMFLESPSKIESLTQQPPNSHRFSYPSTSPTNLTKPTTTKRHSLNLINQSGNLPTPLTSPIPTTIRTRRSTPGRIQKLLGDLYLLAGLLPDAIKHYNTAIEVSRATSDHLWLASALEGWICALILLEYLQADMSIILSSENHTTEPIDPYINGESTFPMIEPVVYLGPWSILTIVSERYEKILAHYYENPLIYSEACLRVSRFLMTIYLNRGCNEVTFDLLVKGKLKSKKRLSKFFMIDQKKNNLELTKLMISEWIMKTWNVHHDIGLLEKIHIRTHMASLYSLLGYQRKCAWLLNEALDYIMALVLKDEQVFDRQSIFSILKRVCEVYGIKDSLHSGYPFSKNGNIIPVAVGWPSLQIDVLRKCISISELLQDEESRFYYTSFLSCKMEPFITRAEKIRLGTIIQGMIINSKYRKTNVLHYLGHNLLSSIQCDAASFIQQQPSMKKDDPFIYCPFTEKANANQKVEATLLRNELYEFKVTLVNPFGFELEIHSIELCTSGISMESEKISSVVIPANDVFVVTIPGTPNQMGNLIIRGCLIQIAGFKQHEFLLSNHSQEDQDDSSIKLKKTGLKAVKYTTANDTKGQENGQSFLNFKIIEEQPILEIKSTSHTQNAISLFEGETATFKIELENTGNIPINFINLHFEEEKYFGSNHLLSPEDQYDLEQFNNVPVLSHDASFTTSKNLDPKKYIDLNPSQIESVNINIFGKRRKGCQQGTIRIGYGNFQVKNNHHHILHYLYVDVVISIYPILDISNSDMMLLPDLYIKQQQKKDNIKSCHYYRHDSTQYIEDILSISNSQVDYCWITIDVKNIWMNPFDICITTKNDENMTFRSTIYPFSTSRIMFPVKRILLSQKGWNQPIPVNINSSIDNSHSHKRLRSFWYRQNLVNTIHASYQCGIHSGVIDMRPFIRFEECFKLDDFEFIPKIENAKLENNIFSCKVEKEVVLRLKICNRLAYNVKSILRIKLPDQVLFSGNSQIVLPEFSDTLKVQDIPLYFLSKGQYDILYILEDIYSRNIYKDRITVHVY